VLASPLGSFDKNLAFNSLKNIKISMMLGIFTKYTTYVNSGVVSQKIVKSKCLLPLL
jgi:hypothetical protein